MGGCAVPQSGRGQTACRCPGPFGGGPAGAGVGWADATPRSRVQTSALLSQLSCRLQTLRA